MRPNRRRLRRQLDRWTIRLVFLGVASLLTAFAASGCGEEARVKSSRFTRSVEPVASPAAGQYDSTAIEQSATKAKSEPQSSPTVSVPPRKMIYDASIDLIVESLNNAEQAILKLIKDHGGFLAESEQNSDSKEQRRSTWRVRVPADRFDSFLGAVSRLGEVQHNHVGSQDVTEEYFDLEARIRNKQEEEKRLVKHLSASTGNLKDILDVERELSRVRGEVEQMQGRLRFLANRTELSTVTITATEWKDFKPPVAATFSTQIGRTFVRSVENLVAFGTSLSLVLVALIPWIPVIVIGLFLVRRLLARSHRKSLPARSVSTPAAG